MTPLALLLGAAWAALVLAIAATHRPAPVRVRAMTAATTHRNATTARATTTRRRVDLHALRMKLGRRILRDASDETAARAGGAVVAAVAFAIVVAPWPPIAPAIAAIVAWWWPGHRRRRAERRRADRVAAAMPEAIDLFLLAVDAGLTVPLALRAVTRRTTGELGGEMVRTVGEIDLGRRVADALDDLAAPTRAGDAARPLVAALVASERYGAPLAQSLVRLADDARRQRRRRAEEAARRLPVTLLFPLVTCTLPAFALLTVAPLIASALPALRL